MICYLPQFRMFRWHQFVYLSISSAHVLASVSSCHLLVDHRQDSFFLFLNGVKKVQSCWESTFFGWHPKNANKWDNKSLSSCAAAQKISTWKHCASLRFRSTHSTVFPRDMLSFNLQWYEIQIFSLAYHQIYSYPWPFFWNLSTVYNRIQQYFLQKPIHILIHFEIGFVIAC